MPATQQEIQQFLQFIFPQVNDNFTIHSVGNQSAELYYKVDTQSLRPGGTVAGPVLMALADLALYVAILGEIGIVSLAVTTNLNINFLRKPVGDQNLHAICKLMKVGKTLTMGEVSIFSMGDENAVAHVTGTYALPTH
ncbi:PaaI family thioesterase [Acinetobacter sp. CFCC 10889]|uniref:PaaI family thioesterase n=1 Tax=Acinetobacter sp. CFCC 10889 TaxID=1775557 RepID=UPI000DD0D281|nr:PaaI family thioesterase [Acinetobacter sp. CFCC 10889]